MKTGSTVYLHFFKHCLHLLQYGEEFIFQNKRLIEGAADREWEREKYTKHKCLVFPTCLFVLRASFGMHGVKTIINAGIESFNSTDLLGQTQPWEFICLCYSESEAWRGLDSVIPVRKMIQRHGSHYLGNFVNNIVQIEWIGTSYVWVICDFLPT